VAKSRAPEVVTLSPMQLEELLAKLRPFVSRGKILRVLFQELYFAELLPYAHDAS